MKINQNNFGATFLTNNMRGEGGVTRHQNSSSNSLKLYLIYCTKVRVTGYPHNRGGGGVAGYAGQAGQSGQAGHT